MHGFESHPPDIIKSIRQRWLHSYWVRLRGERSLPLWSELDRSELESCFDDLTILDVLGHNGATRLRIHDQGKNVGAMYAGQCAGKDLADVLPEATRARTLATYEHVAKTGLPVYTVSSVADAEQRAVLFERLLLPFSEFGQDVFRIIGFLETISPAGLFQRRSLMLDTQTGADFALKAVLEQRRAASAAPLRHL
jgi:hypothetical protein